MREAKVPAILATPCMGLALNAPQCMSHPSLKMLSPKYLSPGFRQGFEVPPLKLGPPKHLGPPKLFIGAGPPNIAVDLSSIDRLATPSQYIP